MSFLFKTKKKISDKPPLTINYYDDGTLYIPNNTQNEIVRSIKSSKLKEIELLNYSINNLQTQLLVLKKMKGDASNNIENSKRELIESIKKEINPDLLCSICFERRVDTVLTPCGHTFCLECLGNTNECYSCRGAIGGRHRIYFG
tara:strand:- start:449 stop:883 length:435 start_codon:yes stop_codon:yes gene_type:complete